MPDRISNGRVKRVKPNRETFRIAWMRLGRYDAGWGHMLLKNVDNGILSHLFTRGPPSERWSKQHQAAALITGAYIASNDRMMSDHPLPHREPTPAVPHISPYQQADAAPRLSAGA